MRGFQKSYEGNPSHMWGKISLSLPSLAPALTSPCDFFLNINYLWPLTLTFSLDYVTLWFYFLILLFQLLLNRMTNIQIKKHSVHANSKQGWRCPSRPAWPPSPCGWPPSSPSPCCRMWATSTTCSSCLTSMGGYKTNHNYHDFKYGKCHSKTFIRPFQALIFYAKVCQKHWFTGFSVPKGPK